jgi:hypothetical protein
MLGDPEQLVDVNLTVSAQALNGSAVIPGPQLAYGYIYGSYSLPSILKNPHVYTVVYNEDKDAVE